ncbi:MAG TPA: nucleotidyltransferase family protein [Blastocatellia bacterium]|nr:nucleotidyltransferase family protein [Blastocatellia bacterium]
MQRRIATTDVGMMLAALLHSAWHSVPPELKLDASDVLTKVQRSLLQGGCAPLAWWRLRSVIDRDTNQAQELRQAYYHFAIQAERSAERLARAFDLFRQIGVEPVLVKGWSVARLYPEVGLRPYGDLDLCVRRDQFDKSSELTGTPAGQQLQIDLHCEFAGLDEQPFDEILERTRVVELCGTSVRIPSPEDSLRMICIHLLRHGAFRPIWLCDVGVLVESADSGFNWDLCLSGARADWVISTVAMAGHLVGADLRDAPAEIRRKRLPQWLVRDVLEKWNSPSMRDQGATRHKAPIISYVRNRAGLIEDLRNRWVGPLEATISVNGPLNNWPRLPFQLANAGLRAVRFAAKMPRLVRDEFGNRGSECRVLSSE